MPRKAKHTPSSYRYVDDRAGGWKLIPASPKFEHEKRPTVHSAECPEHHVESTDVVGVTAAGVVFRCRFGLEGLWERHTFAVKSEEVAHYGPEEVDRET